jgi:hypothetical protein
MFALLALRALGNHAAGHAVAVITITVLLSVVAHGATADPLATWDARLLARTANGRASAEIPDMPERMLIRRTIFGAQSADASRVPKPAELTHIRMRKRSYVGSRIKTVAMLSTARDEATAGAGPKSTRERRRWERGNAMADPIAIGYPDETTADAAADARRLAQDLTIQPDAHRPPPQP